MRFLTMNGLSIILITLSLVGECNIAFSESVSRRLPGLVDLMPEPPLVSETQLLIKNQYALDQLAKIGVVDALDYFQKLRLFIDVFKSSPTGRVHVRVVGGERVSFEMKDILAPILNYENNSKNEQKISWSTSDLKLIPYMQLGSHVVVVMESGSLPWRGETDWKIINAALTNQIRLSFIAKKAEISQSTYTRIANIAKESGGQTLIYD